MAAKADVPSLYWTAACWGSAISLSKDQPDAIAEQPIVEALIDRAFELDRTSITARFIRSRSTTNPAVRRRRRSGRPRPTAFHARHELPAFRPGRC
jgi:hypothetical protein